MKKLFSSTAWVGLAACMLAAAPANAVTFTAADDPILFWTQLMYSGVTGSPPAQARSAAMVEIAMHDAVSAALSNPDVHYIQGVSASGGDVRAAAAQAAHDVLVALYPAKAAQYDTALASSLALVSDPVAKAAGVTTGAAYAAAMLQSRTGDGSATAQFAYTPGTDPGDWRPTSPGAVAALPGWGDVKPFLMTSGDQFRAPPPPDLTSAEYAAAFQEVKDIGSAGSLTRTADQAAAAKFWEGTTGVTWLQIATEIAASQGSMSTLELSRLMASLGTGLADAFIAGFDTKYAYDFWRPATAIHDAALDGNPLTDADAGWTSYITAPSHPSYLSTHSISDGVAAGIILAYLQDQSFCTTIGALSRCFDGIEDASLDGALSRVWGGIHFSFDSEAGLTAGQQIAEYELGLHAFSAVPEPSTWATLLLGFAFVGFSIRRSRARAIKQMA